MKKKMFTMEKFYQTVETMLKGCEKGQPQQQIPHMIGIYAQDNLLLRERTFFFAHEIQKKVCEYKLLGLTREMDVFNLILDRKISLGELRLMLQESQDMANRNGFNHYSGYMHIHIGKSFDWGKTIRGDDIVEFIVFNVLLNHPEIRAFVVIPEEHCERMFELMRSELPTPVMRCPDVFDSDNVRENSENEDLYRILKEKAKLCGMRLTGPAAEFREGLYAVVPKTMRNSEAITRMVYQIAFSGSRLTIGSVTKYIDELHKQEEKKEKIEIGFRV